MEIYILRHGEAEESLRIPDEERSLTPEGRRRLGDVLLRARAAGAGASLILSSPLRRAVETAELAAGILGTRAQVRKTDALRPDAEAIVHTHSPYATALACAGRGIPAVAPRTGSAGGEIQEIQGRLRARETPPSRFCWQCRKPLHPRADRCPFCGEAQ